MSSVIDFSATLKEGTVFFTRGGVDYFFPAKLASSLGVSAVAFHNAMKSLTSDGLEKRYVRLKVSNTSHVERITAVERRFLGILIRKLNPASTLIKSEEFRRDLEEYRKTCDEKCRTEEPLFVYKYTSDKKACETQETDELSLVELAEKIQSIDSSIEKALEEVSEMKESRHELVKQMKKYIY